MPKRRTLELAPEEQRHLAHYRDHDERPFVRERCAALLKIASGKSPHSVAQHGLLKKRDPDTLYQKERRRPLGRGDSTLAREHPARTPYPPTQQDPYRKGAT